MRLLTRADFDGLACGAILMELGLIDSWKFVHPKDMQDGKVEVNENDILANVPYVPGCGVWFDHHLTELEKVTPDINVMGVQCPAPSAARIMYEYYGGIGRMPHLEEMVAAVDKIDSAQLTVEDIINPKGWVLLSFIMDPRTGLGRRKDFSVGNIELMEELMDACRDYDVDALLMFPGVAERVEFYNKQTAAFHDMLLKYSRIEGDTIITDLRGADIIYTGNRFLLYSLFPAQNISIWVVDSIDQNCMVACGHSIINRTSKVNVGETMAKLGGGGHYQVGTCQIPYDDVDEAIEELTKLFNSTPKEAEAPAK